MSSPPKNISEEDSDSQSVSADDGGAAAFHRAVETNILELLEKFSPDKSHLKLGAFGVEVKKMMEDAKYGMKKGMSRCVQKFSPSKSFTLKSRERKSDVEMMSFKRRLSVPTRSREMFSGLSPKKTLPAPDSIHEAEEMRSDTSTKYRAESSSTLRTSSSQLARDEKHLETEGYEADAGSSSEYGTVVGSSSKSSEKPQGDIEDIGQPICTAENVEEITEDADGVQDETESVKSDASSVECRDFNSQTDNSELEYKLAEFYRVIEHIKQLNIDAKINLEMRDVDIYRAMNKCNSHLKEMIGIRFDEQKNTYEKMNELRSQITLLNSFDRLTEIDLRKIRTILEEVNLAFRQL